MTSAARQLGLRNPDAWQPGKGRWTGAWEPGTAAGGTKGVSDTGLTESHTRRLWRPPRPLLAPAKPKWISACASASSLWLCAIHQSLERAKSSLLCSKHPANLSKPTVLHLAIVHTGDPLACSACQEYNPVPSPLVLPASFYRRRSMSLNKSSRTHKCPVPTEFGPFAASSARILLPPHLFS